MGTNDPTNYADPFPQVWCPHIGIGDVLPVSNRQNITVAIRQPLNGGCHLIRYK